MGYSAGGAAYAEEAYAEEAFACTDPAWADQGVVMVRFTLLEASGRSHKLPEARDRDPAATKPVAGVEGAENLRLINKDFDEKIEALFEGPERFALNENRQMVSDGKGVCRGLSRLDYQSGTRRADRAVEDRRIGVSRDFYQAG